MGYRDVGAVVIDDQRRETANVPEDFKAVHAVGIVLKPVHPGIGAKDKGVGAAFAEQSVIAPAALDPVLSAATLDIFNPTNTNKFFYKITICYRPGGFRRKAQRVH